MPNPTPQSIAEKLSEAQRRFVLSLPLEGEKHWPVGMAARELEGLRGFGQSGLIVSRYEHSGVYHRLTELGLQVRAILSRKEQNDG